ncbi:hypothetical protein ROS62_12720 [Streptomyces sp. DSM 41972]|uniref:DUF485 domain-containing protein n=1 Tax=Streptomyces althioticus subsp. attaecolombicae TaxID=3075534 RepID=A0ABU3HYE1_9ACTN|nr:hypothetical protein [Streptomyces sp. DSM 41972]SCE03006.1 hypothetical protein GA0115238_142735 [Streptomyces sp. di50b]SCE45231.1 hypothetical protein GA0115245_138551 [Streptomyces sp. di188]
MSGVVLEFYGAEPYRHGTPVPPEHALSVPASASASAAAAAARLRIGLRIGVRIAGVWLAYVAGGALLPEVYGVGVAGGVSVGVVLALVPLGTGLHGIVAYGRRVDAVETGSDDRRWA